MQMRKCPVCKPDDYLHMFKSRCYACNGTKLYPAVRTPGTIAGYGCPNGCWRGFDPMRLDVPCHTCNDPKWDEGLSEMTPSEDPFESLRTALTTSSRDQARDSRDAWVYGIVVGWDAASLRELAPLHGWTPDTVDRLKRLRAVFKEKGGEQHDDDL